MTPTATEAALKKIGDKVLPTLCLLTGLLACIVLGALTSLAGSTVSGREPLIVLILLATWPFIYLATKKFGWLTFIAFSLFGVVQIEPAPFDLLFVAMILIGLLSGRILVERLQKSAILNCIMWLFLTITLISFVFSAEIMHSLRYTFITFYCISITYFLKLYIHSMARMKPIMIGYLVGALISVGFVILNYFGLTPPDIFVEQSRARGLFKDSNVFGPFLILPILLLAEEMWRPALLKKWPLGLRILCLFVLSAGVFLSFSRAAWGNLLITLLIYVMLNLKRFEAKHIRSTLWLSAVGVATLLIVVVIFDLADFLHYRANVIQSYDDDRFGAQWSGIQLGLSNFVGIGPGMMDRNGLFAPHSLYIRTFAEHGILGFLSLLGLLVTLIAPVIRLHIQTDEKRVGLSPSMMIAVATGLYLNSFLIDTIHWRHFWFVLGLLWVMHPPYTLVQKSSTSRLKTQRVFQPNSAAEPDKTYLGELYPNVLSK